MNTRHVIESLVREAVKQGWIYRFRGRHHVLKSPTTNATVVLPTSPSDFRSLKNARKVLERNGFKPAKHQVT